MNGITKIQLIGDVQGFLDTTDNVPFPVTFSVAEIRDISKRTGAFSKTITLPGTKNNNNLLGSYFDVNIQAGTYNVNKIQQCVLTQNGQIVMESAFIQLISVRKRQNTINEDDIVEYDVIIKDTASMFFSKIGSKLLTDLPSGPFSVHNYSFTSENIIESFGNQYSDPGLTASYKPYKYWLPYTDKINYPIGVDPTLQVTTYYPTRELAPAIYAKFYWDLIHQSTGYSYTWDSLGDPLVSFDKLLITDNKENRKAPEEIAQQSKIISNMSADNSSSIRYTFEDDPADAYTYPESRPFKCSLYYPDEVQDLFNYLEAYDATDPGIPYPSALSDNVTILSLPTTPSLNGITVWTNPYFLNQADVTVTISLNWGMYLKNNSSTKWLCTEDATSAGSAQYFEIWLRIKNETTSAIKEQVIKLVQPGINGFYNTDTATFYGAGYPGGGITTTIFYDSSFTADILLSDMGSPSDDLTFSLDIRPKKNSQANEMFFATAAAPTTPGSVSIDLRLFAASIQIKSDGIPYGATVPIYAYIPAKIKQSDFIKSVSTMFNLYCVTDNTNPNNLIWKRRDDFYDEGPVVDWTYKLDRGQWQEVQFLPELTSKTITLTYKQDNDDANRQYFNTIKEIYGQQKVIFSSEWIKTDEVKELIWSPTPCNVSVWGGTSPMYNNIDGDYNLRVFYDGGLHDTTLPIVIVDIFNSEIPLEINSVTNQYPLTIHFAGPYGGGYDINFGVCDFYYMSLIPTENNLYNLNWTRTMSQLDNQKMLIAYFHLTQDDIARLDMSCKVRIDNSYWNINRIIDYEFNQEKLTKVELISIEESMVIGPL